MKNNLFISGGTVIAPQIFIAYITYFIGQIFSVGLFIFMPQIPSVL